MKSKEQNSARTKRNMQRGGSSETQPASRIAPSGKRPQYFDLATLLGLIVATLVVYSQAGSFEFINYDDNLYVYENAHVQEGLTLDSVKWAFTAVVSGNWMPITLFSHILDWQLFGNRSGMHHLVNVLFHALSAILLFVSLRRATGARSLSAFVAFVFALHPLHVGSVAWVAERKDVLSTFFWFLALYAYVRYAERPSRARYLAVAAAFCLGLMSKPMLVTFPLTLLLFDLWPLRRTQWPRTILEKLPLLALSLAASVITFMVQRSAGAVKAAPLAIRIENAFITYLIYVKQAFVPTRLAVFYPYPSSILAWQAAAAFVVVLAISVLAIRAWRERPYLTVGWFWYLGTLVPVIGLVQVGQQAHADRYTYVPLVGLSIMLAWGGAEVAAKWPRTKPVLVVAAVVSCAVCMVLARQEASYWQNSETLYQRAIAVTERNQVAENNLGMYLMRQGNADSIPHFEAALRIDPDLIEAHNNLGLALARIPGRAPDSMEQFEAVLRLHPDNAEAHNGLGAALMRRGEWTAAIPHFEAALRVNPGHAIANNNLGTCQMAVGNYRAAVPYFEAAIRANADFAEAHLSLAGALAKIPGRVPDAINEYKTALQLRPNEGLVRLIHTRLGMLLADQGHREEAIAHLEAAQQAHPDAAISKMLERLRAGQ